MPPRGSGLRGELRAMVARYLGGHMARSSKSRADGANKFKRYRESKQSKGMRLLRVWAPDPRRPEFAAEASRQAQLLHGRPEEQEALDFIEAVFEWPEA